MTRVIEALTVALVLVGFQLVVLWKTTTGEENWIAASYSLISPWLEANESQGRSQQTIYPGTSFPDPYDGYTTFSACFLVMDENFRLPETLAYAYHTMPLRYAVIAVDPRSKTSPSPVLDQFREQGMVILEWNDSDFASWEPLPQNATYAELKPRHRYRQRRFYEKCMEHLHEANRTWVYLGDPDEFISLRVTSSDQTERKELMENEGWLMQYIRGLEGQQHQNKSCYPIPRLLFGAKELTDKELHEALPQDLRGLLDPFDLDSLRYRYHARPGSKHNGLAKVVIDVSQMRDHMPLAMKVRNPHRPIRELCQAPFFGDTKDAEFIIHHFLGSWEAYSYRDDSRKGVERSRERWEQRCNVSDVRSDLIAGWLKSFVGTHGPKQTMQFLQGVGLPRNYSSGHVHSSWLF